MTLSDKVLMKIQEEWGDNWDQVIDFFGKDVADEIDEAIVDAGARKAFDLRVKKQMNLIPEVNCNKNLVFNEVENL